MLIPQFMVAIFIVAIGILPFVFLQPVFQLVSIYLPVPADNLSDTYHSMSQVSITGTVFTGVILLLLFLRNRQQKKVEIVHGPTWGCGYTGGDPATHQYTATSYADNYRQLARPVVGSKTTYASFPEEELFPEPRKFETHVEDKLEEALVKKGGRWFIKFMERFAVLQTGHVQHYLIYPLVFIAVIFLLTLLKII
jgi:hypothetical protein